MTHPGITTHWIRLALAAAAALALVTCGGATEIELSADKTSISAGGIEFVTVTARARLDGDPVKEGTKISFSIAGSEGAFDQAGTVYSKEISADAAGKAVVQVYSGPSEGQSTVTATFYDDVSGLSATSSITIKFTAASGTKMPVDNTFRITCDAVNIGALREPVPDIQVTCNVTAQTRSGQTIPATALKPEWLTEAGSITAKTDYYTGKKIFVYSPKGGASTPRDVEPEGTLNEPSYVDGNGRKRNPRDGLATIVAVVQGEEAFTDMNGNGEYDSGEPFVDAAEPFLDEDDNDKKDPTEKYIDTNGNGKWDLANGKWDAKTKIMAVYKILWTGKVDNSAKTSRIERFGSSIADGGKLELTAYVLDANQNPVAAFQKNSDYLSWSLTSGGDASSNNDTSPPMSNTRGFSLDKSANTERKRWKILSNSFKPSPMKFTVEDGYPGDTSAATSFTVTVTAYVTPGPTEGGYYLTQLTEPLTDKVQGTCD